MKNLRKKLIYALYILLVAFTSCTNEKNDISRIKIVETTVINRHRLSIIKVDDKEFFVNANGGIEPLSNCNQPTQ
jgi:flagellar biogenesis protein FliO